MLDHLDTAHPHDRDQQTPRSIVFDRGSAGAIDVILTDRDYEEHYGWIAAYEVPRLAAWLMPGHDTDDEDDVATALHPADNGEAGHWPTVADVLAREVRRLRAAEGRTDHVAVTRLLAQALAKLWEPALDWSRNTTDAGDAYRRDAHVLLAALREGTPHDRR